MNKTLLASLIAAAVALPLGANATTTSYFFNLSGAQEVPPTASPAAGSFQLMLDDVANTISFSAAAFGLTATPVAAHIHMAPAGLAGGVVYPLFPGADTSGPVFIGPFPVPGSFGFASTAKPIGASLIAAINAAPWNYYVNIHTPTFPGGEIRGQLAPVPEPASYALLAIGLGVVGVAARRRRQVA